MSTFFYSLVYPLKLKLLKLCSTAVSETASANSEKIIYSIIPKECIPLWQVCTIAKRKPTSTVLFSKPHYLLFYTALV